MAEWTSSRPHLSVTDIADMQMDSDHAADYRVVKGGGGVVIEGLASVSSEHRNPLESVGVSRFSVKPGLGFRCVQSAVPRVARDDF